jgi:deoxyribonuclease V
MKVALDVHYESERAVAACVTFQHWQDGEPVQLVRTDVPAAAQYHAGRFYQRELPCLLAVLEQADEHFETILIDGFVHLKPEAGKGLGAYLSASLSYPAAIIGVAKSMLRVADQYIPILRGKSGKPLYISSVGCSLEDAARWVEAMHGVHRIPALLKLADQHARSLT